MERPIFIVGCPRSGTTLLQLMLHAHRRIAIPPETRFLLPAYYKRSEFGPLASTANRRRLGEWIVGDPAHKIDDLGLPHETLLAEIEAAPGTIGSVFGAILRAYARSHGKPRWGDKRPTYVRYLPELHRLFPDAQFVHVIRDGRDCVGSLKGMSWWGRDTYYSVSTWAQAIDAGHVAARRLPDGSYYEIQYEHLVADPAGQLAALCDFLGEGYDEAMLRPHELASVTPRRKTHHARTHGEIDSTAVAAWRSRLEPWEVQLCETVLAERLATYGYDLTGPGRPAPAHLTRYAQTVATRKKDMLRRTARDGLRRLGENADLACRLDQQTLTLVPGLGKEDGVKTSSARSS